MNMYKCLKQTRYYTFCTICFSAKGFGGHSKESEHFVWFMEKWQSLLPSQVYHG